MQFSSLVKASCEWIYNQSPSYISGCHGEEITIQSVSRNCSTWCRSLLLSFSTCYLDLIGFEGAMNCILARTSHQRTTSKRGQKLCSQSVLYSEVPLYSTLHATYKGCHGNCSSQKSWNENHDHNLGFFWLL